MSQFTVHKFIKFTNKEKICELHLRVTGKKPKKGFN